VEAEARVSVLSHGKGLGDQWRALLANPLWRLELGRVRRKRLWPSWWPGRRPLHLVLGLLAAVGVGGWQYARLVAPDASWDLKYALRAAAPALAFALPWAAISVAAPAIARERETGTLDLLRVTALGEEGIVAGKLVGSLVALWPCVLLLTALAPFQAGWRAAGTFRPEDSLGVVWSWPHLAWSLGTLLRPWAELLLDCAVGLAFSSRLRTTAAAVAASGASILVLQALGWLFVTRAGLAASPLVRGLKPLSLVVVEMAGAVLLLRRAAWGLGRE
jgi:hypothetical protein